MEDVDTVTIAREAFSRQLYVESAHLYIRASKEDTSRRERLRDEMLSALSAALDLLRLEGDGMAAFSQLMAAISTSHLACDKVVLTMVGTKCLDEGFLQMAQGLLEAALAVEPGCPSTRENLRVVHDKMVDRWHFHMLNDITRNSAYFQAIRNAVREVPDCTVLDIGSGTGILSMMAARVGAKRVYACEMSETMLTMSHDIVAANRVSNVTVIHSHSTALSVPRDLPERVNVVVTETVDAGLLGECIIPVLKHAWKELLLPRQPPESTNHMQQRKGGVVIPCGATVHTMAVECPEIRRKSKFLWKDIGGLTIGDITMEGSCKKACEWQVGSNMDKAVGGAGEGGAGGGGGGGREGELVKEPYTCERLSQIRGGYRALTHNCVALQFDFNHPEVPLPPAATLHLQVIATGQVDALVTWFDLHLDPNTSFSTAPSWDISWDQALFPVEQDLTVQVGDTIVVNALCSDILLEVRLLEVLRGQVCNDPLGAVDGTELMQHNGISGPSMSGYLPSGKSVFYVERSALQRLNDSHYTEAYQKALCLAIAEVAQTATSDESSLDSEQELESGMLSMALENGVPASLASVGEQAVSSQDDQGPEEGGMELPQPEPASGSDFADCIVLDVAHEVSVFGLLAARDGADYVQIAGGSPAHHSLLERLAQVNGLHDKVSIVPLDLPQVAAQTCPVWDIVVSDIVSPQGTLNSGVLEELAFLSSQCLHSKSIILPCSVTVHAMCVSSPALRVQACVLGTVPTLGFDIARFINQYQVSHWLDIDLSSLPHDRLTLPFSLLTINLNSLGRKPHKVQRKVSVPVTMRGSLTGIAYWFSICIYRDVTIATGPECCPGSHWHQALFLLPEDVAVQSTDKLTINGVLGDSCLDITLLDHVTSGQ